MTYATRADLATRYGERELIQVTDKAKPPSGAADEATIARALADADAEIDSRIGVRYTVPLAAPAPGVIVDAACRIARYKLHEDKATEKIRRDYEDAVAYLRDVATGRANVPGATEPSGGDGVTVGGRCAVAAPSMRFTDAVLGAMP